MISTSHILIGFKILAFILRDPNSKSKLDQTWVTPIDVPIGVLTSSWLIRSMFKSRVSTHAVDMNECEAPVSNKITIVMPFN